MNESVQLKSYFNFTRMPFTKYMWAQKMFEASSQKELLQGLQLWLETRGMAIVYGPPGVGKSITLRRFKADIDDRRYEVFYLYNLRVTPLGFLRSLARVLNLPVLYHQADLFDALSDCLEHYEDRCQRHPILILDDGDNLSDALLELLRLMANFVMDSEDRFSFILSGTQRLAARMRLPVNEPLKQRIGFSHSLRGFTVDDAVRYVQFHLQRAEGPQDLFSEEAVKTIFNLAKGLPRVINQLAQLALIRATIARKERIDETFLKQHVVSESLFDAKLDELA